MAIDQSSKSIEANADRNSLSSVSTTIKDAKKNNDSEAAHENGACEPESEKPQQSGPAFQDEAEKNYKPKTAQFWLVMLSAFVAMFLVAFIVFFAVIIAAACIFSILKIGFTAF